MQFINRAIAVIKPKQPFVDWVNSTDPDSDFKVTLEQIRSDPICILIPEYEDPDEAYDYLKETYNEIWQWALFGYWTDKKDYPKQRLFSNFKEWFDVEFSSEVIDFVDGKIKKGKM